MKKSMAYIAVYSSLFVTAFLAATIFPAQSETLLALLIVQKTHIVWLLVTVASIGNILGSCINWWLGTRIERFKDRRWFPVNKPSLEKAQLLYQRYGRWSLLLSWVPFIGDPLTIMAGILREKFLVFLLLVSVAKTGRYVVLALILTGIISP